MPTLLSITMPTFLSFLTILALILGPVIAVRVERLIAKMEKDKQNKKQLFSVLMATRGIPLDPKHIEALNLIDIVFHGDKKVIESWKLLWDHLGHYPQNKEHANYLSDLNAASEKTENLKTNLLFEMGQFLNYNFDKVNVMRGSYTPQGVLDTDDYILTARDYLLKVMSGEASFPIHVIESPEPEAKKPAAKKPKS